MNLSKSINMMLAAIIMFTFSFSIHAIEWVVDSSQSQLNFVSIKKNKVAEVHVFKELSGIYDSQGQFLLQIDLASVDTHNLVRDDRMKQFLFEVNQFSTAKLVAKIDTALIDAIAEGANELLTVNANLELHGVATKLTLDVIVTRLVGAKLSVVSAQPIIINAGDFGLIPGINKLMALAALPSISEAVPVSFYITLKLK